MQEILYSNIEGTKGTPMLVIHGYLGMSDNWKSFAKHISELGYQVHVLDLRNHGRSFHSQQWSYQVMVQDVINYMDYHNLQKAIVLGHSMGGKVAMNLATQHPLRVEKLIVADISPREYAPHHQDIFQALDAVDFSLKPSRAEVDKIISHYISDQATKLFLLKSLYWVEPGQLGFRFNKEVFNDNPQVVGEALDKQATYDGPTLFIRGQESNYILEKDWELIQKHFSNVILRTIPNAGHWLHAQNPELFFKIVNEFLQGAN
ncbi:alpha/beta fold hydrolase [Myroides sp. LJL119]